ncbi:MAG: hypothetical protein EA378_09755 [Phycisphaerales bacterium]|nr:MAG: hypothetical protein EA378_09755 [Phycisphaerales bacterium]
MSDPRPPQDGGPGEDRPDNLPPQHNLPPPPGDEPTPEEKAEDVAGVKPRVASMKLARAGQVIDPDGTPVDERDRLDTANASLLDALRITFRLLIGGMFVLAGAYFLSGFQPVNEGERAVRTVFGAVQASDVGPGFQFSLPYPFGELVRVQTNPPPLSEESRFWPGMDGGASRSADQIRARGSLEPGREGSLITADGNIAHARFNIVYRRNDLGRYVRNIYPAHEERLLLAAVRRGVVTAVAEVDIDELLKQSSSEAGSVAARARQIAQQMLDEAETGLFIEQLRMIDRVPPGALRQAFNSVQDAEANASRVVSEAERDARQLLNSTAGQAVASLTELIESYGNAMELGDAEEAASLLARIDAVLEGEAVPGGEFAAPVMVSGRVTEILNDARRSATSSVSRARSGLESFRAFEAQYAENPELTVRLAWQGALTSVLGRPFVQTFMLPVDGEDVLRVRISQDPELARQLDREQKRQEAEDALERRNRERMMDRFRTQTGGTVTGG